MNSDNPFRRITVTTYEGGHPVDHRAVVRTSGGRHLHRGIILTQKGYAYLRALKESR